MARTKKGYLGKLNPNWKGGPPKCNICQTTLKNIYAKTCLKHMPKRGLKKPRIMHNGYYMVYKPEHPFTTSNGYIKEHRLVMEFTLGRFISKKEIIHHINHNKLDNRPENLMILDLASHTSYHSKGHITSNRQRKIISKKQKGNKYWLGKKHTDETKSKMSVSRKLLLNTQHV